MSEEKTLLASKTRPADGDGLNDKTDKLDGLGLDQDSWKY
jgi:hypothetical protein